MESVAGAPHEVNFGPTPVEMIKADEIDGGDVKTFDVVGGNENVAEDPSAVPVPPSVDGSGMSQQDADSQPAATARSCGSSSSSSNTDAADMDTSHGRPRDDGESSGNESPIKSFRVNAATLDEVANYSAFEGASVPEAEGNLHDEKAACSHQRQA